MSGKAYGYITLLIGYVITGVGIYYLSYAKGEYHCNPVGPYHTECAPDQNGVWGRIRKIPHPDGAKDPDNSIMYIDSASDPAPCPRQNCQVGPWTPDRGCYEDSTTKTKMQKWKRTIEKTPTYGGTPCPNVTAVVTCGNSPTEPFRFLRRRHRKLGIEGNANYGGGIAGIVFGIIFVIVGHVLVFTTGK